MVSGTWPPDVCGVGDYTETLSRALEAGGVTVLRFGDARLSQIYSPGVMQRAAEVDCDVVHIQYPTVGYGRSYTPAAMPRGIRGKPVVVTLHEFSVFRWYRRAWFSPYAEHCAARIFTTDEERLLFGQRFPQRGGIDDVIEIGSNIPIARQNQRDGGRVVYFGLIAPNKGLEAFVDLAVLANSVGAPFTFEIVGAVQGRHRAFAETVLQRAAAAGVRATLDAPEDVVAERLGTATFAYLPFPDGATGKRGTLAASIVNRLIVITRHSTLTPPWMAAATFHAKGAQEALALLTRMQDDRAMRTVALQRTDTARARYRWDVIAGRHAALYARLLNDRDIRAVRASGRGERLHSQLNH